MESLPLKELDFGLQKPTRPSLGVVASIVLVSPELDRSEWLKFVLLVSEGGSLVIEVQYLKLDAR